MVGTTVVVGAGTEGVVDPLVIVTAVEFVEALVAVEPVDALGVAIESPTAAVPLPTLELLEIVVVVIADDSADEDNDSSLAVVVIGESGESSDASLAPQPISSIATSFHPIRRTTRA
ncbi:MAG: hypothetical protein ACKOJ9_08565 [Actinomycetota bacterium]